MKKSILAVIILAFVLFVFSGCDNSKTVSADPNSTDAGKSEENALNLPEDVPSIYTVFSDTNPKEGDKITATVYLHNVNNLAAIDILFSPTSSAVSIEPLNTSTIQGFTDNININTNEAMYGGFVMSAVTVETEELFTLELTIGKNCKGEIPFNINILNMHVASDESGSNTRNIISEVNIIPAVLTVQ